ncbi:hypothetical protein BGX24_000874 [Mortierella sp. AD032]|nr:hypothetical protein BGX24_000874 [Mortierella sp. AD032]
MSTGKPQHNNNNNNNNNNNGGVPAVIVNVDSPSYPSDMPPPPAYSTLHEGRLGERKTLDAGERAPLLGSGSGSRPSQQSSPATGVTAAAAIRGALPARASSPLQSRWHAQRDWYASMQWHTKRFIGRHFGLIVAAVIGLAVLLGIIIMVCNISPTCEVPENAEVATMSYTFNPEDYREFFFHLDEGIMGDIIVTQSRDREENNVTITITAQGSTPDMLSAIALNALPNRRTSLVETNIFLNMNPSELRTALSRNCTRVEVEIAFPRSLVDYDLIQLESRYGGHVVVQLQDETTARTTTTVERIEILAKGGDVSVKQVSVARALNIVAKQGVVQADVEVGKIVKVQASDVDLALESISSSMDVKVSSSNKAQVIMKAPLPDLISSREDMKRAVEGEYGRWAMF